MEVREGEENRCSFYMIVEAFRWDFTVVPGGSLAYLSSTPS